MEIVPITMLREAENQGDQGLLAVYCVIRNRSVDPSSRWPNDEEEVCLQPYQFSCWNTNDKCRTKYFSKIMIDHATAIIKSFSKDITNGATYYINPKVAIRNPFTNTSLYVKTAEIGDHIFYKDKK